MKEEWKFRYFSLFFVYFCGENLKALNDEKNNSVLHISDNGD